MKTTKNNFWRIILLGLALAGSLASAAFGMNQDGVSAPDLKIATSSAPAVAAPAAHAEQIVTIISNDDIKYQVPLNMIATLFRGKAALSQVLYNMLQDYKKTFDAMVGAPDNKEGTLIADELFKLNFEIEETQINLKSDILKKVIAIFTHLYEAKKYGQNNIENEANYFQMLDRESIETFTGLATQDKRALLLDLYATADYLDSKALYDLCERQLLSPEITQDLLANPQEYTNQWLLAERKMPATAGTGIFHELQTLHRHHKRVWAVTISADGNTIFSGSDDRTMKVWTRNSTTQRFNQKPQILRGDNIDVYSVAISANGNTIACGPSDHTIKVWTKNSTTQLFDQDPQTLHGHENPVNSVAISTDGNTIVSGALDHTIKVWTISPITQQFECTQTLVGHEGAVLSVAISNDGNTIVSGSADCTIKVWTKDPATLQFNQEPQTLRGRRGHNDWVVSVAISTAGNTIVSGSRDNTIKVWTINPTTLLFNQEPHQTLHGHEYWINSVAISTDGKTIVSGSNDHTIKVWAINPTTQLFNQKPQTLHGHDDLVYLVTISSDDNTIVSGSKDYTIKVWQRDYFNGTVSILQAMFIEATKQAPRQMLDLNKDTSANKALRTIAHSFTSIPAKDFVRAHVIMDWAPVVESAAAPADTKRCIIA